MKYILVFILAFIGICLSAQVCTPESLIQKPGIWKGGLKGSVSGIMASDLARERKVVAQLHAMMQGHYTPMAVEILFNGVYNSSLHRLHCINTVTNKFQQNLMATNEDS